MLHLPDLLQTREASLILPAIVWSIYLIRYLVGSAPNRFISLYWSGLSHVSIQMK